MSSVNASMTLQPFGKLRLKRFKITEERPAKRLLFVVNVDWFFLSHRLPIALEALRQGYEVHVAVGVTNKLAELQSYGFIIHPLAIARGRASLKKEVTAFYQIFRLFRRLRPDLVHLVTIKPVLFGGIAARLAGVPAVVAAISGLGFVFTAKGWRAVLKRYVVGGIYRLALGKERLTVIFQNPSDQDSLCRIAGLPLEKVRTIRGSGVELDKFMPAPFPAGEPVVVMACRLLADKGVWEFAEAARSLHRQGLAARFWLVGSVDPDNPTSLDGDDLAKIEAGKDIELLGLRRDIEQVFSKAHIVVLPSYYGEGLPKVLMEAAACGRPVVTTDMPGCRDAIRPGITGLLVPARDAGALANAIRQLLENPAYCQALGRAGRILAENEFGIQQIVKAHMQIYEELLAPAVMPFATPYTMHVQPAGCEAKQKML